MEKALDDPQKLSDGVLLCFVFDEGNENQLSSLKAHADDPAYEVKLQIEMAISRMKMVMKH